MRRDQLEQARPACQIIQHSEVIVAGSEAIVGTYDESQLSAAATISIAVDILPTSPDHCWRRAPSDRAYTLDREEPVSWLRTRRRRGRGQT